MVKVSRTNEDKKRIEKSLMRKLMMLTTLLLMAGFLISCGKVKVQNDRDAGNGKEKSQDVLEKAQKIVDEPSIGDRQASIRVETFTVNRLECQYEVGELREIREAQPHVLVVIQRTIRPGPTNSTLCPAGPPDLPPSDSLRLDRAGWNQYHLNTLARAIDPDAFVKANSWASSAKVESAAELNYKNLKAVKIVLSVSGKDSRRYTMTVYNSLESRFLGVFEYAIVDNANGNIVRFQTLTSFSIKVPSTQF